MKIKNKIAFILGLFFIFLLFLNVNSVNASVDYTYNEKTITLPDLPFDTTEHPTYVIIYNSGEACYQVGYPQSSYDKFFTYSLYGTCIQYYIEGTTTKGQWVFYECNSSLTSWGSSKVTTANSLQHTKYVLFSTVDIYKSATSTELFFQVPVTETPEPETPEIPETEEQETLATTIPALETVEQIPTAMVETLKLIIPVGLVIFGILLVILLVKLVILRVI